MTHPRAKRILRIALYAAAFALEAGAAAWILAPLFAPDALAGFAGRASLAKMEDRNGVFLGWLRPPDLDCRMPVPLEYVSTNAVAAILAVEDADFRSHGAVDWLAAARAAFQNAKNGRVVSGASTVTMQTASLANKRGRLSAAGKLRQIASARRTEYLHSKDEILETYLNNLPFGGKITGIEAAARYYFGTTAADLTLEEAVYLAGIPQKPNRFRPDRHPKAASERYALACSLAKRAGVPGAGALDPSRPPVLRDFRTESPFAVSRGLRERAYPAAFLAKALEAPRSDGAPAPRSTLDIRLCEEVENVLRSATARLSGVRDAAAVVVDNATGEIVAYVGTLDFASSAAGQVDAARAVRSAGSTLKPFFYAEAVEGGVICADTILDDSPVRFGNYAPLNFSREWSGRVTAADALSRSLNAPAVALVASLGAGRVAALLARAGLSPHSGAGDGLSVAFGTGGHTLLELSMAYSALATGRLRKPVWTIPSPAQDGGDGPPLFSEGTRNMVSAMLRSRPLENAPAGTAWKTGTSNNLRDAWCMAYTPRWTVGVWFGNKDGTRSENLVGGKCAAPAAGAIMSMLERSASVEGWSMEGTADASLCAVTGLSPSRTCSERKRGTVLAGIPLRQCRGNHAAAAPGAGRPLIIKPTGGEYAIDPDEDEVRIPLEASDPDAVFLVDGKPAAGHVSLGEGLHTVEAVSGSRSARSIIDVRRLRR